MRKKKKVIWNKKEYIIWELTVWLYWLLLEDVEQFIEEIFSEFNNNIPKINNEELSFLLQELFWKQEKLEEKLLQSKASTSDIESFHIIVGQFIKFFGTWYEDTMRIPFRIFQKLLQDAKKISWEEEVQKDEGINQKQKLKNLLK